MAGPVSLSEISARQDLTSPFDAFLADVGCLGVNPAARDGAGYEYAVIAARSNARWWIVPVGDARQTAAGLDLFHPMTPSAQLAKNTAAVLVRAGLGKLWRGRRISLSGLPDIDCRFTEEMAACAYFTGTAGPHRKSTIQVMGLHGQIIGYAKISRNPFVRNYLGNEARFLRGIGELNLRTADVPACLSFSDGEGHALLVTDSTGDVDNKSPRELTGRHLAFLCEVDARTRSGGADVAFGGLRDIHAVIAPLLTSVWNERLARGLAVLAPDSAAIPACVAHGDFTPWNCFLRNGKLYVFDWEYADAGYPVGYDYAHFHLSAFPQRPSAETIERLVEGLASNFHAGDRVLAARALLLSLLLHAGFYLRRAVEAREDIASWEQADIRAAIIDRLLIRISGISK